MPIDFVLDKVIIDNFRGIDHLELNLRGNTPKILIGSNNAGKSSILNAIALALNGGGFHQWSPLIDDFYCANSGERAKKFSVKLLFWAKDELGYPAVKAVGDPVAVHGIEVIGTRKYENCSHTRRLIDANGKAITLSPRTPLKAADKAAYAEHDVNFKMFNARLDDIRDHVPSVWLFRPQNLEAALYVWKTGPIARLSKLLADRFVSDKWDMSMGHDKPSRAMPDAMQAGHRFFQAALQQFPFWRDDMKPHLETVFGGYVGSQAKLELRPDAQQFADWIAQQLTISLAVDPESVATPLRSMGDGWQSVIRLATLEAMTKYPELVKERVVLLVEEPETHLHPHLRRKVRKVFGRLAAAGWVVVYTTHSAEMVSFAESQEINRLVRSQGAVKHGSVNTATLDDGTKLQGKLDEKGAHDFLFGTAAVFCEGPDDAFALQLALEKLQIDCDGRAVSITQCRGASGIPAFSQIAKALGIRFYALTDEDKRGDGSINPATQKHRSSIEESITDTDRQGMWPINLEAALKVTNGKATPEISNACLSMDNWSTEYPSFAATVEDVRNWIS